MELAGNSDYTLLNYKVIVMGLEARGRKWTCPNLRYFVPFAWRDSLKPFSNQYSSQDSSRVFVDYKPKVLQVDST